MSTSNRPSGFQGATILETAESHGAAITDSPVSPHAVAQAITDQMQAAAEGWRQRIAAQPLGVPWVPPPPSVPRTFHVYNRLTGKYVCDMHGNETADEAQAHGFADHAAADLFIQQSRGTAIERAVRQPPPDDPPSCDGCWRPQVRGAITCPHCNMTLQQPTGWVHVFAVY